MRTNYTYRNLLGKTFGKLTVIEDAGIGKNDHMWKCECLCGNIVTITSSKLTSGHNKSCGCLRGDRREVLTGQKFGILTVIERILLRVNKNKKRIFGWLCRCECGNSVRTTGGALKRGRCKSCGCTQRTGIGEISGSVFSGIRIGAEARNLEFNITKEYIWQLWLDQKGKCALTGWPLELHYSSKIPNTASLDRIDSTKGYVEGNVQWVHVDANFAKQEYDQEYFIDLCEAIYKNKRKEKEINWI